MKIELKANEIEHDRNPDGLEIAIAGFQGDPSVVPPSQVFLEVYQGKLLIHTWDGSGSDPATVSIAPLAPALPESGKPKVRRVRLALTVTVPESTTAAQVAECLNAALDEENGQNWNDWIVGAVAVTHDAIGAATEEELGIIG